MWQAVRRYFRTFGYRQVPVWYGTSIAVTDQFETISRPLKFLKVIPNPYPFYDWIMGFHERWSNRAALRGPVLERTINVVEAGVGTGYFLAQLVRKAKNARTISAVDLSPQVISAAKVLNEEESTLFGPSFRQKRLQMPSVRRWNLRSLRLKLFVRSIE